jgi:hypothetical protein
MPHTIVFLSWLNCGTSKVLKFVKNRICVYHQGIIIYYTDRFSKWDPLVDSVEASYEIVRAEFAGTAFGVKIKVWSAKDAVLLIEIEAAFQAAWRAWLASEAKVKICNFSFYLI